MSRFIYANNVSTELAVDFGIGGASLEVASSTGDDFPVPGSSELLELTLENIAGDIEIVHVDGRTADTMTVASRAEGGTSELAWVAGDRVEIRPTAESLQRALQREDDYLTGDMDAAGNEIQNVVITGDSELRGADLMNNAGSTANNIHVPHSSGTPTVGGNDIWHEGNVPFTDPRFYFPAGMIMMWYSSSPPPGWNLCDGSTPAGGPAVPDLRARFVIGYNSGDVDNPPVTTTPSGLDTVGDTGGDWTRTTSSNGSHGHTGATNEHALTTYETPAHRHRTEGEKVGGGRIPSFGRDTSAGSDHIGSHSTDHDNEYWYTDQGQAMNTNKYADRLKTIPDGHTHGIDTGGSHQHTTDEHTVMPYITLAFIVKLDPITGQMPS